MISVDTALAAAQTAAAKQAPTAKIWPDPEPLSDDMPEVPAFVPELLPSALRDWVLDIAERLQCPVEFVAAATISVLGSILGRQCAIRPKRFDDWAVLANLWCAIVGPPSSMKSPAMSEALRLLRRLVTEAAEKYAEATKDREYEKAKSEARRKHVKTKIEQAAKKGDGDDVILRDEFNAAADPEEETERRYSTSDSTTEKLGELLIENPNGLLVERDELTGFFRLLDRDGRENDRAFYLESWEGTHGYTQDRIGRGTTRIPAVCLTLLGGIQPGILGQYMAAAIRGGAGDDGLVQRFQLMVYPDPPREWHKVDRFPNRDAREKAYAIFKRLANLSPSMIGAATEEGELPHLRFDVSAQAFFDGWLHGLMNRLRLGDEHPAIEAHLSKYTKLMPALALVFHLVDTGQGAVSLVSAQRAAAWCDLLESHARRVYACVTAERLRAAKSLLGKVQTGKLAAPFTARTIYRAGWAGLTEREAVEEALATLVDHGWLRSVTRETASRPATEYVIHPTIATQAADLSVLSVASPRNPQLLGASCAAQKKGM